MSNNKYYDLENAIEETKFFLQQQYDSMETIKKSIRDFISSSAVIISFLSLIQIGLNRIDLSNLNNKGILLLVSIALYLVMISISLFLLSPKEMDTPMKIEMATFNKLFIKQPHKKILENKLNYYLKAVGKNRPKLDHASRFSKLYGFLYIIIILFVIASLLIY